jgi:hypothetical protein
MIKVPIFFQLNKLGIVGAQKELRKLTNQTKSFGLSSKLSIGAASVALTAYTKKALSAAIADEKAQKALTQTLKNLGLAYSTLSVTKYIDNLQRATGVSEDQLRPAFQRLVLVLGDVGKAQSALSLAMDISAGTGKDLNSVSMALSRAYSGNFIALSRLGAGLDKALIKSGDMEAITAKLSELFAGQALVAADTYAGQMAILGVAAQEASETIGVALIDALVALSGENGVADLATQMETLAQNTANTVTGMAEMARLGKEFAGVAITIGAVAAMLIPAGKLAKPAMAVVNLFKSKKVIAGAVIAGGVFGAEKLGANKNAVAQGTNRQSPRATERAAQMAAEKLNKTKKTTVDLNKKITASEKLKSMFDIDSIQLQAALKGKISELDRASLLAMQALKTEDQSDDIKALERLEQAKIGADAADRARKIKALNDTIAFNKLALADWEANFAKMNSNATKMLGLSAAAYSVGAPSSTYAAPMQQMQADLFKGTLPDLSYLNFDLGSLGAANAQMEAGIAAQQGNITVNVNPSGSGFIGNQDDFLRTVQMALQIGGRNGYSTSGLATG